MALTRQQVTRDNSAKILGILRILSIIAIIVWMFVIYNFSADTSIESSQLSSKVTDIFNYVIELFTGRNIKLTVSAANYAFVELCVRKLAHMFIYFVLSITIMLFLFTFARLKMWLRISISLLFCFGYACLDEFHQSFVAGRGPSFTDSLIDTTGAFIGIIAALLMYCIIYTIYHKYQKYKIRKYNESLKNTIDDEISLEN